MLATRRFWLGATITAAFLVLLFVQFDVREMLSALADANYAYLVPGIAVYFVSLYFRAFRWRTLLRPFVVAPVRRLYPVVLVGYTANNLLPIRLGEFARSYFLSTREPVRASTAFATIVVERVFDGITLLLFLALAAAFLPVGGLAGRIAADVSLPVWVIAVMFTLPFALAVLAFAALARSPALVLRLLASLAARLPVRASARGYALAERFIEGFVGLDRPGRIAAVLVLSLPIWLAEATMYYIIGLGFGLDDALGGQGRMAAGMLAVTAASNLATSIPSSQGSVGPFEYFAALTLAFLGVEGGVASAYAVVLHVALLVPVIVAGLLYLATRSVGLGQVLRGTVAAAPREKSP